MLQQFDRAANGVTFELNDAPVERNAAVHSGEQAEGALAADIGGLDGRTVLKNGQQRQNRALREIGVFQQATGFADERTQFVINRLEMGIDALAARRLQSAEQLIAQHIAYVGHCHRFRD